MNDKQNFLFFLYLSNVNASYVCFDFVHNELNFFF